MHIDKIQKTWRIYCTYIHCTCLCLHLVSRRVKRKHYSQDCAAIEERISFLRNISYKDPGTYIHTNFVYNLMTWLRKQTFKKNLAYFGFCANLEFSFSLSLLFCLFLNVIRSSTRNYELRNKINKNDRVINTLCEKVWTGKKYKINKITTTNLTNPTLLIIRIYLK